VNKVMDITFRKEVRREDADCGRNFVKSAMNRA
jgi:hypothetical protein